ncbi:uncharacterized protein FIBRA_01051 [Fibroporia radiculosa]|uniref:Glucose 1-dehydrogenase n=1 Tax=Fibroporia radiculosa TaxID=599839 RepID=J4HSP1_9APHY|nr:uncharacterized protein FIBRA_01051 [Fibroporia radiculosa]CCL99042.1 predicted protein [Fibroporia radiculosa]
MSGLLANKVVCITGSSRGIGRACAVESAKHGATGLVLHYLGDSETETEIQTLKVEVEERYPTTKVAAVAGDIADPATSSKIVQVGVAAFGRIDVLVSNAGICPFAEFLTMPHATWERTRSVNLDGSFFVVQVTPSRGEPDAITESPGRFNHWRFLYLCLSRSHYTPTKAGILSLMQSCAIALGKYNIRANAVLPGTIATDINKEDLSDAVKRENMIKRTVLGRLGAPDDIAGPVVFLASDLAKYVTGASLLVDGGLFVNLQ